MFFCIELFSQGGGPPPPSGGGVPGGGGGVDDVGVPITDLIYPFLVLGAYLGIRFSSKRKP